MTVWYLPIEPYEERYTAGLTEWTINRFKRRGVDFHVVTPDEDQPALIQTGVALDAHRRTRWGLRQTAVLVSHLREGNVQPGDAIYTQDLYQPGLDGLLYVLNQTYGFEAVRIFTHNLAQTIDPDDFTHGWRWMRDFEWMVDRVAAGVFYASTEHKLLADVAGFSAPGHVVGLLHDRDAVRALYGLEPRPVEQRARRIVYTSRFDREKQPHFFMDLALVLHRQLPDFKIQILTSAMKLRSNDPTAIERARQLEVDGCLEIVAHLDKRGYYALLAESRLQINTARQDWVSNTLLESSALGTPTLAPAFRGFPEAMANDHRQLYVPWSLREAETKAIALLDQPPLPGTIEAPSRYHDGTLDRVIDIIRVGRPA
jgi:glycosyltransferase involved in cell wall biosynthesis